MGLLKLFILSVIFNLFVPVKVVTKSYKKTSHGRSEVSFNQFLSQRQVGYLIPNHGSYFQPTFNPHKPYGSTKSLWDWQSGRGMPKIKTNTKDFEYKAVPRQGLPKIGDQEHILQSDPHEVRLYLLRTDQEHIDGPEDFIRFSISNEDIIPCLKTNLIVVINGFSPFNNRPKYGYDVFAEQRLLRIAYDNYEANLSVFLLDWTTFTTRAHDEYQLADDKVEYAANIALDLFFDIGLFDEDKVKCVGFEYLGKRFCEVFLRLLKQEAKERE